MSARRFSTQRKKAGLPWQAAVGMLAALAGAAMLLAVPSLSPLIREPPFAGHWQPVAPGDGSMRLVVSGRAAGPFALTWMDAGTSLCAGETAILHGTASLDPWHPNEIEAVVHAECPSGDVGLARQVSLRFHPMTGTLSMQDGSGAVSVWERSRAGEPPPAPLYLRVNYGDNWVESFYPASHRVWVMVTEPDGVTVRASTETTTEPKDYWDGDTGFSSLDSIWQDQRGSPMIAPPDVEVGDWVFAWADNGASNGVQIGEIRGVVDPTQDSIAGTVSAPWLSDVVVIECLDWWSGPARPHPNTSGGFVHANGADHYSCSWRGKWDIQPGYGIGVGYTDENDNWVSNVFRTPYFTVFAGSNGLEGWDWPDGAIVTATIEDIPECTARGTAGFSEESPTSSHVRIDFPRGCNLLAGDRVILSDGRTSLSHDVRKLEIESVDPLADTVAGTAEDGAHLDTFVHGFNQPSIELTATGGKWLADFGSVGIDITDGMCGRAEVRDSNGDRTAMDWCLPAP